VSQLPLTCGRLRTNCGDRCSPTSIFFFQAEDGIRDSSVTGVQTCALPICRVACSSRSVEHEVREEQATLPAGEALLDAAAVELRSEERRVGKECRWGWSRCAAVRRWKSKPRRRRSKRRASGQARRQEAEVY